MSTSTKIPQLSHALFLTDGGLETTLIFREGIQLPDFAAFTLLASTSGRHALERYYLSYIDIAKRHGVGIVLDTPTWRASADWGRRLGYSSVQLRKVNAAGVKQLMALRAKHADEHTPIVVSGTIGPRGDGYAAESTLSASEAEQYHSEQIRALADGGADFITAQTIAHVDEAIGIVRAAIEHSMRVVISFTVEVDGRLPSGQTLEQAIIDLDAATDSTAAYIMVNCAYPTHLMSVINPASAAFARVRGMRANASSRSHAQLDESDVLDDGDPAELAGLYRDLLALLPNLTILGGCCGTDDRHIEAIATACAPAFRAQDENSATPGRTRAAVLTTSPAAERTALSTGNR